MKTDYLKALQEPGTCDDVYKRLLKEFPNIKKRTVRHNIYRLEKAGMLESKTINKEITAKYTVKAKEWRIK